MSFCKVQDRRQVLERTFNLARTTHGSIYMITGQSVNLANLRLSLIDRCVDMLPTCFLPSIAAPLSFSMSVCPSSAQFVDAS